MKERGYKMTPLSDEIVITGFFVIKYQEKGPGYFFPGETHCCMELIAVDRGFIYLLIDDKGYKVNEGELFFFGRNQNHILWSDRDVAPSFVTISFEMAFADEAFYLNKRFKINDSINEVIKRILMERQKLYDRHPGGTGGNGDFAIEQLIKNYMEELMIKLYRIDALDTSKKSSLMIVHKSEEMIVQKCQEYIANNMGARLTISVIAGVIPISASYLNTLFHKTLGCAVGEYIIDTKLDYAKKLILKKELNMTQISTCLGYSSIHYFSRLFKGRVGVSPAGYAKTIDLE